MSFTRDSAPGTHRFAPCFLNSSRIRSASCCWPKLGSVWHKAKLHGVSFRAIGQEPGWLLEITDGSEILLVTDYGQSKTSYPYVEPDVFPEERRTRFSVSDHDVQIIIEGKACRDSMSGEEFAVTVTVTIGEVRLTGCGRALY